MPNRSERHGFKRGPIDRYTLEVERQLDILNRRLADNAYVGGPEYTIADIALWPWYGALVRGPLYGAAEFLDVQSYTHVDRWAKTIAERPAAERRHPVNRICGDPETQLRERHHASDLERPPAPKPT